MNAGDRVVSLLIIAACLALSASAAAQLNINDLKRRAERGDAKAQFNLGVMYGTGQGVPQDYAEVTRWFRKAADQENLDSEVMQTCHKYSRCS